MHDFYISARGPFAMASRLGIHESVAVMFPPAVLREALAGVDAEVRVVGSDPADLEPCDALVTFRYDEAFLDADVGWIHSTQAGVNKLPLDVLEERGVAVTSSNGIHGTTAGETVAGYMLSFARCLHLHVRNQVEREWAPPAWDAAFSLTGESACVVGLGTLGQGIAQRADALGMRVTGVRRTPTPVGHVERVYTPDEFTEAVAEARFVALAVPLTESTRGMIGAEELAAMREDAYLLNVARGEVVDEAALIDALADGEIAGAALDVFETEPLPADSPLWGMENVIVTPHEATDGRDKPHDVARLVRENHRRFRAGEELANRIA